MNNTKNLVTKHFDKLSKTYDDKSLNRKKYLDAVDELIISRIKKEKKDNNILDVGCGTGKRSKKIQDRIKNSIVYGCDQSPNMIKIAKKYLKQTSIADMSKLGYKKNKFDEVMCLFNSFGYLNTKSDRISALKEFRRVIKEDGILFIDVMNFWHLGEGVKFKRTRFTAIKEYIKSMNPNVGLKNKYFELDVEGKMIKGFVHGFTDSEMKRLLKESGFNVEKMLVVGYDTGKIRNNITQGQLFYICRPAKK